jgi:HlyB family type I secretion system ABC transporter
MNIAEHPKVSQLLENGQKIKVDAGERICEPSSFSNFIYFIKSGCVRLLAGSLESDRVITITKLNSTEWIGLSNLLYGEPCEWCAAATETILIAIPVSEFASLIWSDQSLLSEVVRMSHYSIGVIATKKWMESWPSPTTNQDHLFRSLISNGCLIFSNGDQKFFDSKCIFLTANLSCGVPGIKVNQSSNIQRPSKLSCPPLLWATKSQLPIDISATNLKNQEDLIGLKDVDLSSSPDIYQLGIREIETSQLNERYPERQGKSLIGIELAIFEMLAKTNNVPFRKDQIKKRISAGIKKYQYLDITGLGMIVATMGLEARPVKISISNLNKIAPPFLLKKDNNTIIVMDFEGEYAVISDGKKPVTKVTLDLMGDKNEVIEILTAYRGAQAATDRFNWNWVWGIVKKYRNSLLLVVIISLMSQLFALGVPLLIQQLIDKVLSQGNISSLNVLAALMIAFALFQNVLTALRTFLFVDTTDRIDLSLGSSIIDRLLKLPLSFFEKRPVGELSQRIGEMNTIRNFLTGTAITTFLDLVFSSIYLIVMLTYSPGLTAVALSTFPFYLAITLFVAPVYRQQLRTRAIAQAATQAHLIETLGGIQTVKAQHGELRARWKWQQRYQRFVEQGYKSVVLGTSTGQIGSFLNTLSSLLILWFGLRMVLDGQFTLGQLLAFRIFAGYVTAPLLRISNLWQGLQKVNLSMERLSDIVNQETEAGDYDDQQISLPPIIGNVNIDSLSFGFGTAKQLQLENVNLNINSGEFIGVVGLSGSGKSTLMKLIARLYPPKSGRILIDGVDISKVQLSSLRSQIGLVPQDSVLFEGSISENIALNNPNTDTEDIIKAAKLACAHDFIMELPQGYATRVAEKGANFSGGQRQRLAIARMIIESPSLLIMDEATSALDADTERRVCRNLMSEMKGRTVLFVTHRMATIMRSDRVVVMDKGHVAEFGTPQELVQSGGIFAALWKQQS